MANVLTEQSTITCVHFGTVKLVPSQNRLRVGGALVLVEGDLNGSVIADCKNPIPPATTVKCTSIVAADAGVSRKLKVGGKGVLLATSQGTTNGAMGPAVQRWLVQNAGQNRLKAV